MWALRIIEDQVFSNYRVSLGNGVIDIQVKPLHIWLSATQTLKKTYREMLTDGRLAENANRISFSEYNQVAELDKLVPQALYT